MTSWPGIPARIRSFLISMGVFCDSFETRSARGCPRCKGLWLREDVLTEMVFAIGDTSIAVEILPRPT